MVSVLKDEIKDVLYRRADKCTKKNGYVTAQPPQEWTASRIKALRNSLRLAQPVFADILAVSNPTVIAWENGINVPSPIACRLLDLISINPDILLECGVVEIGATSAPKKRTMKRVESIDKERSKT